ncbi:MAG: hypothetical protein KBC69_04135 [Candidatus Magasanikbacteria bacterium]|nr:hypothetical protein [Candidatus Magasanikbacteria bacterium]
MLEGKPPAGYQDGLHGHNFETTTVGDQLYNVELLERVAELLPTREVPLNELAEAVSEGNYYWTDRNGDLLGPYDLLKDWDAAKQNQAYADHVATIQHADLSNPIWRTVDGQIFNGMHRLTRAFLDKEVTIKLKDFPSLPDSAIVNS